MESRHSLLAALLATALLPTFALAAKPPAAGDGLPSMPKTAPGSPTAAIKALADAYEHESVGELGAVLSADFRFHPSESESLLARYMTGWDREHEMNALAGVSRMLDHMRTSVSRFESGPDPAHPDAPSQYRVVVAHDFAFSGVAHANGERVINTPADHIFHLVRGDAAALAPGQAASRNRWYIREWFESARAAETALAQVDGHCDEAFTQAPAPLPHTLAVHAVDSPLCSTLKLLCDLPEALPATVEVFDIAGRRLSQRTLTPSSPGVTMPVEAGNGARFAPGAYFVRLSQGRQKPVSRMVLVAR